MKETPVMLKTPSGYVQQSPWLSVANKQLELMGRYTTELDARCPEPGAGDRDGSAGADHDRPARGCAP